MILSRGLALDSCDTKASFRIVPEEFAVHIKQAFPWGKWLVFPQLVQAFCHLIYHIWS